jgi:hypothetical protein
VNNNRLPFWVVAPIPLVMFLSGCGQSGPSDRDLKSSLQADLPPYWEVQWIQVESRGNRGSEAIPIIETRYKASIKLTEDIFKEVRGYQKETTPVEDLLKVAFLTPADKKGKEITIYGTSTSKKYQDTWKTDMTREGNAALLGYQERIRSEFLLGSTKETVIIGSSEEEAWKVKLSQQIKTKHRNRFAQLLAQSPGGYFNDGGSRFRLDFGGATPESKTFIGKIKFAASSSSDPDGIDNSVKEIQGSISENEIRFVTTKLISGKDDPTNLGNTYIFPIPDLSRFRTPSVYDPTIEGTHERNNKISKITMYLKGFKDE